MGNKAAHFGTATLFSQLTGELGPGTQRAVKVEDKMNLDSAERDTSGRSIDPINKSPFLTPKLLKLVII